MGDTCHTHCDCLQEYQLERKWKLVAKPTTNGTYQTQGHRAEQRTGIWRLQENRYFYDTEKIHRIPEVNRDTRFRLKKNHSKVIQL